jgi:hypothetical protein
MSLNEIKNEGIRTEIIKCSLIKARNMLHAYKERDPLVEICSLKRTDSDTEVHLLDCDVV